MSVLTLYGIGFCLQTALAAHTLADNPSSVVAGENFEVFAGAWRSENNDLSVFVREVSELADPSGQASGYPLGPGVCAVSDPLFYTVL